MSVRLDAPSPSGPPDLQLDDSDLIIELETGQIDCIIDDEPPIEAPRPRRRLGELLVEAGLIEAEPLAEALAFQKVHGGRLGEILVSLGLLSEEALRGPLAQQLGVCAAEVESINPPAALLAMVPEAQIRRLRAIPIRLQGRDLVVGLVDPTNAETLDQLRVRTGRDIVAQLITEATLRRFLRARFGAADLRLQAGEVELLGEAPAAEESALDPGRMLAFVLDNALRRRATDIHIEAHEGYCRVRLRVDGALHTVLSPPAWVQSALLVDLKRRAGLGAGPIAASQEGHFSYVGAEEVELRVSTLPTLHGEKAVVRLPRRDPALRDLSRLGLRADQQALLLERAQARGGLLLFVGPVGSGRSTTQQALLNTLNEPDLNITAVDDPIGGVISGVNLSPISGDRDSALLAVRAALRQDPDVLVVGEAADAALADTFANAALGGPRVLATLVAPSARLALQRLLAMGADPWALGAALKLVVAQRLVRRLCARCAQPAPITEALIARWGLDEAHLHHARLRVRQGCPECLNTGYRGRIALFELLRVDNPLREALQARQVPAGSGGLFEAARHRLVAGDTDAAELEATLAEDGDLEPPP